MNYIVWMHQESDEVGIIPEYEAEEFFKSGWCDRLSDPVDLETANKIGQEEAEKRVFSFTPYIEL